MVNRYGLDLEKTVFVIDSPVSAFMVSILSGNSPVTVVVEKKIGLETDNASELLMNFVISCINTENIKVVNLPHRFYIRVTELKKIWNIRQQTRRLYDEYSRDTVFVGAPTSTFMRSLTCNSKNIIYLYHGLSDLIMKEVESENRKKIKWLVKDFIIGKMLGLPNSIWCSFWADKAYSLCKLKSNDEKWLDIYDFESSKIERSLGFLEKYNDSKKNVLFFPVIEGHVRSGVKSDVTSFDQFNYEFLSKYVNPGIDRVFVKYHPWLYRANDETRSNLIEILRQSGIEAYDIASMIPDDIGGVLLPTEVICRYGKIDKMISRDTSTMWYLSGNKNIEKIIDISQVADERYLEEMVFTINRLKEKSEVEDINFVF